MTEHEGSLRMCSYNIHKGMCAANRQPVLEQIRHAIRTVNADLMFLQEVVGQRQRSHFTQPQFEYLADSVWPHHAYGRNAIYQRGHHGNAILSQYPFVDYDNIDISRWWFSQRGILLGELSIGVYVACVHFGLLASERSVQMGQLLALMQQIPREAPLLIAGDLNDWRLSLHRRFVKEAGFREVYTELHGEPARTFPARWPLLAMDRVYYRGLDLLDVEVLSGKPWSGLSDHCALYAEFALPT